MYTVYQLQTTYRKPVAIRVCMYNLKFCAVNACSSGAARKFIIRIMYTLTFIVGVTNNKTSL